MPVSATSRVGESSWTTTFGITSNVGAALTSLTSIWKVDVNVSAGFPLSTARTVMVTIPETFGFTVYVRSADTALPSYEISGSAMIEELLEVAMRTTDCADSNGPAEM